MMIGASAHIAQISMQILRRMFPATLISCVALTSCGVPSCTVLDYFLWVCIKDISC